VEHTEEEAGPERTLTPREQEVLRELAAGAAPAGVAASLDISVLTVRGHLRSIMHKLGAHSAGEAVVRAFRLGLVEADPDAPGRRGPADALGAMARRAREASRIESALTPREREVLRSIGRGLTTRQIGTELGISHRTAQSHIAGLYTKLGVGSRVQAVARATRLDLIG